MSRSPGPRGIVTRAGGQVVFGALLQPAVGALMIEVTAVYGQLVVTALRPVGALVMAVTAAHGRLMVTALRPVGALVMAIMAVETVVGHGSRLMEAPAVTSLNAVAGRLVAAGTASGK